MIKIMDGRSFAFQVKGEQFTLPDVIENTFSLKKIKDMNNLYLILLPLPSLNSYSGKF